MYALTKSGVPIYSAMIGLADTVRNPTFKAALRGVADSIGDG